MEVLDHLVRLVQLDHQAKEEKEEEMVLLVNLE